MGLFSNKKKDELNEESFITYGKGFIEQKRYDEAISFFDIVLKVNKNNLDAIISKGIAHQNRRRMFDSGAACKQYQKACKLVEKKYEENKIKPDTMPFYLFGEALLERKYIKLALKQYYKILEFDPEDVKAMTMINELEKLIKKNR